MKINLHHIWPDYELLDSGNGMKLERFGYRVLIRPELSANHKPFMSWKEWEERADARFNENLTTKPGWQVMSSVLFNSWKSQVRIGAHKLNLELRLDNNKHVGVFPEQILNWKYVYENTSEQTETPLHMLNLFAYTGIMSLVGSAAGYRVVHVEALKQLLNWGKSMMLYNGLDNIRWICDDAQKFVQRELRRGKSYDLIVLDPPVTGVASGGKRWKRSTDLMPLLENCKTLLAPKGKIILSLYAGSENLKLLTENVKKDLQPLSSEDFPIQGCDHHDKCISHGRVMRMGF